MQRLAAEALGTFWLVFAGCGSALLSAGVPQLGIGVDRDCLRLRLTVVTWCTPSAISRAAISIPP